MRGSLLLFVLLVFGGVTKSQNRSTPPQVSVPQWVDVVEKAHRAIVTIETQDSLGTGFFIEKNGTLITNYHVIKGARQIAVSRENGEVYKSAYILRTDEEKDIAVLRIEGAELPFLALGNSDSLKVGEEIMAIGTPEGLEQTVSTGIVSSRRLMPEGYQLIQITAPISHGSSGGPLLNRAGECIGIVTASLTDGQNLNFAVPINYARGIIDTLAFTPNLSPRLISGTLLAAANNASGKTSEIPATPRPAPSAPLNPPAALPSTVTKNNPTETAPIQVPPPALIATIVLPPTSIRLTPAHEPVPPTTNPDLSTNKPLATIWFYRAKSLVDSGVWKPTIYSQGQAFGKLGEGRFFGISVPPGKFYFSLTNAPKAGSEGWAIVTQGQQVFFKIRVGAVGGEMTVVAPDQAMKDMKSMKAIEPSNIFSPRVVTKKPD